MAEMKGAVIFVDFNRHSFIQDIELYLLLWCLLVLSGKVSYVFMTVPDNQSAHERIECLELSWIRTRLSGSRSQNEGHLVFHAYCTQGS